MPGRLCLKKTGPCDSSFISNASKGVSHEIQTQTPKGKKQYQKTFYKWATGSCNGVFRNESTGKNS